MKHLGYYSTPQIAEGLRHGRTTVWNWTRNGYLPGIRIGRSVMVAQETLLQVRGPKDLQAIERAAQAQERRRIAKIQTRRK